MNNKHLEIELKFKIDDFKSFDFKLMSLVEKVEPEILQRTVRFDTSSKSLEEKGVFLRVRTGHINTLTIKTKKTDQSNTDYLSRNEWEIEVSDPEMMQEMLRQLGFTREVIMEKYRKTYYLEGTVVTLDRLPFGYFSEIEGEPIKIEEIIKKLELTENNRITVTYWDLFEDYKKQNGLEGDDIVFEA